MKQFSNNGELKHKYHNEKEKILKSTVLLAFMPLQFLSRHLNKFPKASNLYFFLQRLLENN